MPETAPPSAGKPTRLLQRIATLVAIATITLSSQGIVRKSLAEETAKRPNIVLIMADDLGYGDVGAYGQAIIQTPSLDRLAREGVRLTQHLSGSPVCAPCRCTLLTGLHTGHAVVRNNRELGGFEVGAKEGQQPLPDGTQTLAKRLHQAGYVTGAFGKWGLGGPEGSGHPNKQGFDEFFGYLCQRQAHNYYPTHLWHNETKVDLDNEPFSPYVKLDAPPQDRSEYQRFQGKQYAPDLIAEKVLSFVEQHADKPFFLYYPTIVPHIALQVPEDSLASYDGKLDSKPYLGEKGYLPHPQPRAAYAAMVTRMDGRIGRLLDVLEAKGLRENTIVIFTSDNGPAYNGGTDSAFFRSAGPFRGLKGSVYEGGIRVPMIVRWPGRIAPRTVCDHPFAHWDLMPTLLALAGAEVPDGLDGIDMLPALTGRDPLPARNPMVWELGNSRAYRDGDWKLVQHGRRMRPGAPLTIVTELYHLGDDPSETTDLATKYPDKVEELTTAADAARTPSTIFPAPWDRAAK